MEQVVIYVILAVFGLCLGSYAGATVWRLRGRQLVEDKKEGEKVDAKEYKKLLPLTKASITNDRSRCLSCGHTLAWYDLIPLASWLSTGGKCRYCKKPIGRFEPIMEIATALSFVLLYFFWPFELSDPLHIAMFFLWLVALVQLAILFAYDLKWYILPNRVVFPLIGMSAIIALLSLIATGITVGALASLAGAIIILSGLYLLLWLVSKGQWIGFGDIKLGLALAFLVGTWDKAFIALFAANLIGCLLVVPGILSGKMTRKTRVPFGPLLILGAVIAFFFGRPIIEWYLALII